MYPSDYGYATSGGSTKDRSACLAKELFNWYSSAFSDCKRNDYLFDTNNNLLDTKSVSLSPDSSTQSF